MNIAILGWGSLLWEGGREFDEQHHPWELDGPTIKIEFSRISQSRQGALTLVIDDASGQKTKVAWCRSKRQTVEDAICDLQCREGTIRKYMGCILAGGPQPDASMVPIADWARAKKLDAVIWTALKSNFKKETKREFTVDAAVEYLKSLDASGKARAAEYVWRAPEFVQTELRKRLQQEPWF